MMKKRDIKKTSRPGASISKIPLKNNGRKDKLLGKQTPFNHKEIENKWLEIWLETELFYPKDMLTVDRKDRFYNLWMFPYPSAEGLHAGHAYASTGGDIYGRFMRMSGKTVFQPIGYDSFGIHSENFALKIGEHPAKMLTRTTKMYAKQLQKLGHGYDWTRTVTTSDINYYRWTQWLFLQLFKAGLAYRKAAKVNWCPSCKTVLADEQVVTPAQAGKEPKNAVGDVVEIKEGMQVCERCGTLVEEKKLEQWFFRITDYADRLLENLDKIDWSERVVTAQRNWIGKSSGATLKFEIRSTKHETNSKSQIINNIKQIRVFTTRPDTLYGATFMVVSPEYAKEYLLSLIPESNEKKITEYINQSLSRTKEERVKIEKQKTGVDTGIKAINPATGEEISIYVADYVLYEYGTGAIMGVPAHDERDFEFAKKYKLPIVEVIEGGEIESQAYSGEGKLVNSGEWDGLKAPEEMGKVIKDIEAKGWGKGSSTYHLRDWLISRQRYWGAPIPMIFCETCAKEGRSWFSESSKSQIPNNKQITNDKLQNSGKIGNWKLEIGNSLIREDQSDWEHAGWWPEANLPVELPNIADYKPKGTGRGPLANHPEFYEAKCPHCGEDAKRETDVMDTFVDSSWYFLRYPSVENQNSKIKTQNEISKLKNHQPLPWDPAITKTWLPVDLYFGGAEHSVLHLMYSRFVTMALHDLKYIEFEEPFPRFFAHGLMIKDGAKMSKSRGNIVNPDEYIEKFGADTLRLYLMFMGPMDGYPDFRDTGIEGMRRFIDKVWRLCQLSDVGSRLSEKEEKDIAIKMHQTIKKVTIDIEKFHYNTAIAAIMEYVNLLRDVQLSAVSSRLSDVGQSDVGKPVSVTGKLKTDNRQTENRIPNTDIWNEALKTLALLLAPFAPHMTEELWQIRKSDVGSQKSDLGLPVDQLSNSGQSSKQKKDDQKPKTDYQSIHLQQWPKFNPDLAKEEVVTIAVQVNGKLRATLDLSTDEARDKEKVVGKAKANENVAKWFGNKSIENEVFVPGKLVNFVVAD